MNQQMIQSVTAAVIAVIAIGTGAAVTLVDVMQGKPLTDVPPWLALLIGAIIGSYYTQHASVNGARQAGVAAAQTAITAEHLEHPQTPPVVPPTA